MSTNQFNSGGAGGGPTLPDTFASGCSPTTRVIVGGTEVPTIAANGTTNDANDDGGVHVEMRKTGASDLMRTARATVPYEWQGADVFSAVGGFDDVTAEDVRIDVKDDATGEYVTVHGGPLASIGPAQSLNGAFRFRVGDYANVLSTIAANRAFVDRFTPRDVISYVLDQATQHDLLSDIETDIPLDTSQSQGFDESISGELAEIGASLSDANVTSLVFAGVIGPYLFEDTDTNKTFTPNRHTLVDVLDWLCDLLDARWWMRYNNGPVLTIRADIAPQPLRGIGLGADATQGDVRLINNNALFQLSPQHTLGVHGKTSQSKTKSGSDVPDAISDLPFVNPTVYESQTVYPEVVVQHSELADRAGTNSAPQFLSIEATTLTEAERTAKRRLTSRIDGAAGGQMIGFPAPLAVPYGTIEARPNCDGDTIAASPIRYEIEEVIHDLVPPTEDANSGGHRTIIRCGIPCTDDDLEVVRSEMINV